MEFKWEIMLSLNSDNELNQLDYWQKIFRAKVFGGWLIKDTVWGKENNSEKIISNLIFISDPQHEWDIGDDTELNKSIEELELTVRSTQVLFKNNISTIGELVNCTPSYLLKLTNFGHKCLEEVRIVLNNIDRKLKNDNWEL